MNYKKELEKLKELDTEGLIKEIIISDDGEDFSVTLENGDTIYSNIPDIGSYTLEKRNVGEDKHLEIIDIKRINKVTQLLDVYKDIIGFIDFAVSIIDEFSIAEFHNILYYAIEKAFSIDLGTYDFFITMHFDLSYNLLDFSIRSSECEDIEEEKQKIEKELKEIIKKYKGKIEYYIDNKRKQEYPIDETFTGYFIRAYDIIEKKYKSVDIFFLEKDSLRNWLFQFNTQDLTNIILHILSYDE